MRAFHQRHYQPGNAVLVMAGDLKPADTFRRIEDRFGPIRPPAPPASFPGRTARRTDPLRGHAAGPREPAVHRVPRPVRPSSRDAPPICWPTYSGKAKPAVCTAGWWKATGRPPQPPFISRTCWIRRCSVWRSSSSPASPPPAWAAVFEESTICTARASHRWNWPARAAAHRRYRLRPGGCFQPGDQLRHVRMHHRLSALRAIS